MPHRPEPDHEAVGRAIRHAHTTAIEPRFRALKTGEVEVKDGDEVVTVADREGERLLSGLLRDLVDAPVLGEEAAAADPGLIANVLAADAAWVIDPIDGTSNFVAGSPEYAVMVAFVIAGRTTSAWILQPQFGRLVEAGLGAGARVDGRPLTTPTPETDPSTWRGVIKDRFLPAEVKPGVLAAGASFGGRHTGGHCAGVEYPTLVAGGHGFLLYWRTLPWDHAPGALVAEEAGCLALRPDGTRYRPDQTDDGLIVAHETIADTVRTTLFGSGIR